MLSFHVGKTNAPSNGSSRGDIKNVLVSLLQQRVLAEAQVSSNLMSMKCVNVLVGTKKAIVPEALRRLFAAYQDKLPERERHQGNWAAERGDERMYKTNRVKSN